MPKTNNEEETSQRILKTDDIQKPVDVGAPSEQAAANNDQHGLNNRQSAHANLP